MEKTKISVEQTMAYEDAVAYLEDILASFKSKKIVVQRGEEFLAMIPPETVDVELSAKMKKGKAKLSLELSWRDVAAEGETGVKISDSEPEIPSEAIPMDKGPETAVAAPGEKAVEVKPEAPAVVKPEAPAAVKPEGGIKPAK